VRLRWIMLGVALAAAVGCRRPEPTPAPPPRLVTAAPHITEIAFDMGLGDHVVGVSRYCILPPGERRTIIGDALRINSEAILVEKPDAVFFNTRRSDFALLERLKPDVKFVRMENRTLEELRRGIAAMGRAVGREDLSDAMLARMDARLATVAAAVADRPRRRVLLLQGYVRPSTIGSGWLTDELITVAGGANAAAEAGLRSWAVINLETIRSLQPEVIICLVAPGEESLARARAFWDRRRELEAVRAGRVFVTDDRRLTIPGSQVARTAEMLARMIHPEAYETAGEPADE